MRYIGISFSLKGQDIADIRVSLEKISQQLGGTTGDTILVHGFMPRHVVVEKGFSTDLVDALSELFPYQINCYADGKPNRELMAKILKEQGGEAWIVGDVIDGVKEEEAIYMENLLNINYVDTKWDGVGYGRKERELSYGEKSVGLTFNHGEGEIYYQVRAAKQTCAKAIDQMNDLRAASESDEYKELCTIAVRKLQSAQMDMVKAITWKD